MKGSKAFPTAGFILVVCALLLLIACGGTPQNGPSALNITTSSPLPVGAEGDGYSQTINATGGLPPYTWTLDSGALPPGFTFSSGGVLSGTPPAGSAGSYSFTVRATDTQSPTKAYQTKTLSLTINPPLSFPSSSLANGVIAVSYSSAVVATGGINNNNCPPSGTSPCYTYSLASGSSPLPAGLTLNSDGTITGTPAGPIGTFPFTVQVTDQFPTTATANFSITIVGKIQGYYAFSFSGFNQQGQAFYMVGSFVADGSGNITSGVFDRNGNDSLSAMTNVAITPGSGGNGQCPASGPLNGTGSVYCVGRSSTNGTNLGTIVIASSVGTYSFSVAVSLLADSRMILADPNNPGSWGSGALKFQGLTLSGTSLASANFAFGMYGLDASGNRYGGAGYFLTDSNGNINSGSGMADLNDNGTVQSMAPLTGSVSAVSATTSRATASFTIGSTTLNYAMYVVPPPTGKLFPTIVAVQTDPISSGSPVTLASFAERAPAAGGGFTNLNLNATQGTATNGDVFELDAVSTAGGTPVPDVSLGEGNFDGKGNITGYTFDENNGGTLTTPAQNSFTGTYSVDSANALSGRVTVNLTGATYNPVWYLVTFNTGYVIGTDPNVTTGTFEPQSVSQPIQIVSLLGTFYGGTVDPVLTSVINNMGALVALPPPPPGTGTGTITETYDSSGTTGILMDQTFNGGFCLADSGAACPSPQLGQSTLGRVLILDSGGNPAYIMYFISSGAAGATSSTAKNVLINAAGTSPALSYFTH